MTLRRTLERLALSASLVALPLSAQQSTTTDTTPAKVPFGVGELLEYDIRFRGAPTLNKEVHVGNGSMPRAVCDGQDVFAVRAAMQEAVDRARSESIPTLLEVRTHRFMGHSMSDAASGTYRSKAELDENMKRDPIALLRAHMHEQNELTEDALHKLDDEMKAIVQDAWDFADQSPEPPLEALFENVLVDTTSDATAEPVAAD